MLVPLILVAGLYDQTMPSCRDCNYKIKAAFNADRSFIEKIESALPDGSAVYQLPYMPFPETHPLYLLSDYSLLIGFLHSRSLHWSYGGMKGRQGDLFYRALAQQTIEKQIDVVRRLGFSGIYVDRRGFENNGDQMIEQLTHLIGPPTLVRNDGEIDFFIIPGAYTVNLKGLNDVQIIQKAN